MKQDRFLALIVGVIGLLIVAALVLFFVRRNSQSYSPENTPEGVIHNYILSLEREDYEKAYGYIAASIRRPDFAEFERALIRKRPQLLQTSIRILSVKIEGNQATVLLSTTREDVEPFDPPRSYSQTVELIFQEGVWKLTRMPYDLWH